MQEVFEKIIDKLLGLNRLNNITNKLQPPKSMYDYQTGVIDSIDVVNYVAAEYNGLLLRLPCKVGDTVFVLMKRGGATDISNGKVRKIHCGNDGIWWVEFCDLWVDVEFGDFGKIAFLSLKEAEAKLAEMEGGHE